MKILLMVVGGLVLLVVIFMVFMYFRAARGSQLRTANIENRVHAVTYAIRDGKMVESNAIAELARSPETRNILLQNLRDLKREDLFPKEYLNARFIAESDLVFWLMHPNELNAAPDQIELVKEQSRNQDGQEQHYFIFKFRTLGNHWAAKDGWTAGIAGPYPKDSKLEPFPGCVFSRFEKIESRTPEGHLDVVLEMTNRK